MRERLFAPIAVLPLLMLIGCRDADPASATASPPEVTATTPREFPPSSAPVAPIRKLWSPGDVSRGPQPDFRDVAAGFGIDFQFFEDRVPGRYLLPEVMGGGGSLAGTRP
jgi:hypothetical protein